MSLTATLYPISREAYSAAVAGDMDRFNTDAFSESLNIGKAWNVIHYIVTGKTDLNFLEGGHTLDTISETAEVHSPEAISSLANAIGSWSASEEVKRINWSILQANNVYLAEGHAAIIEYIEAELDSFFDLVKNARRQDQGMFVIIA